MPCVRAKCAGTHQLRRGDPSGSSPPRAPMEGKVEGAAGKCTSNDYLDRKAHHSLGKLQQKTRRRHVTLKGLGGGCALLSSHRPHRTAQSACAPRLLRGRGRTYPHTALSRTLGCLPPAGGQVARRLPGRHFSVAARPWRACLGLLWAQYLGKAATWCPQVVFCPQAHAGHSLEQRLGRLIHDRTSERQWQRLISHTRPTPRLQGRLSSALSHGGVIVRVRTVGQVRPPHAVRPQGSRPRVAAWCACSSRVVLVFRHAVGSKQHGRSAPAP